MGWLLGLPILGLLILIHELGHLLAAKWLGARASVFSIGFGHVLWSRSWRGTEYRLSAVPLGGFVLLDDALDPARLSPIRRMIIFAAGPLANVLLAAALLGAAGRLSVLPSMLAHLCQVVAGLLSGAIPIKQLAGPVGLMSLVGESAARGPLAVIGFTSLLSLNLAILNLLPLPVLDGGQILIAAIELAIRRPLALRIRLALAAVTWVLLLGLLLYVTVGDVARLVFPVA